MLNNDHVQNSILHRPNSKTNRLPFLVPISDSLSMINSNSSKTLTARTGDNKSLSSRKSIRVLRPETIKRAINDACMAAAIGDLEWLKQTFKISTEKAYDKNGFATIHLASIHGRLNVIRYLIEEQHFDPNLPSSMHSWCPIHLCISNQIGSRSIDCLNYLIERGANINIKNSDDISPLHMAASEGQIECLKILLKLKADAFVKDMRGQTPLDLAKLWGHRTCSKLLSGYIWDLEKKAKMEQESQENKLKTQDILNGVEQAHISYYSDKEESQKNFDQWLINQGFISTKPPEEEKKIKEDKNSELTQLFKLPDQFDPNLNLDLKSDINSALFRELTSESEFHSSLSKNVTQRKERKFEDVKVHHPKQWNYSTKAEEKDYVSNLGDFFPRDPYTLLPINIDLVMINRELKGMSLEQVKEFMTKKFDKNKILKDQNQLSERPVYYKPKNIIDVEAKAKPNNDEKHVDLAALNLGDDPKSFPFKQVTNYIVKSNEMFNKNLNKTSSYGNYYDTEEALKQIKRQLSASNVKDDKLEIVRKNYSSDLSEFMMNKKHGKMSQKYEKVFIC